VAALQSEGNGAFLFNGYPRRRGNLILERFDNIPGPGMLNLTVNLTQVAPDTNIFNGINSFHGSLRISSR
jgi:hypothetical protein